MMVNRKLVLALTLLSASLVLPAAAAERFRIEDIRIEGLQRVSRGAALTYLPVRVGDQVDEQRLSRLIRSLYSSGNFDDIQVLREGNVLIFQVQERPTISNIEFSGNKDIPDEQLQQSLDNASLQVGEPLDRTQLSSIERALEDFFYSSGKYSAEVNALVTPLPRNRVDLKIVVKEGEAASIQQINIIGNRVFPEALLLEQMELRDNVPWWNLFASDRYQKQVLQGDLEKLRSYYMDRGYIRVNVENTQVSLSPDKKGVYITISLDEGEQYKVKAVNLSGELLDKGKALEALLPIAAGDIYSEAEVTFAEELISKYLGRFGYAYPQVRTFPEIDDETREVTLTLDVDPGQRIHVRRINFSGNALTADEVLRREMRQMEGSWLSNVAVEQSRARLNRLGYFRQVNVDTRQVSDRPDQVDLNWNVEEQPSGSVSFGVGYGTAGGLSLQAGLQQDNFLGTGNRVGVNVNTNSYSRVLDFSYDNPYFTVDGVSFGSRLFYSDYDSKEDNGQDFTQQSYGLEFDYGIPINEYNRTTFGVGLRGDKLDLSDDVYYQQLRFFLEQGGDTDQTFNNLELSWGWSRNTLNRGSFPTDGSTQRLSLVATAPFSDLEWYKATLDQRYYYPLNTDHTWAFMFRNRLGFGNAYGDDNTLPFWENFRSGQLIRGFKNNTIGPRSLRLKIIERDDVPEGSCDNDNLDACVIDMVTIDSGNSLGGNAMYLLTGEFFFPTPFLSESYRDTVRTSLFIDAGNVWDTKYNKEELRNSCTPNCDLESLADYDDPWRIRVSAGVSLQWLSPLGAMIFSLGYPIVSQNGDNEQPFTFTIGRTF